MSSRRAVGGVLLSALLLGTAACGGGSSSSSSSSPAKKSTGSVQSKVQVSGAFGAKPTLTIKAPLTISSSSSWTLTQGTGTAIAATGKSILQLTLADARTGKTAISTADTGQSPVEAALSDQIFPSLVKGLTGQHVGSRIVVASTAADSYGANGAPQLGIKAGDPVVMVADILATDPAKVLPGPTGASIPAPAKAPKIELLKGKPNGFDVSGLTKPKQLEVFKLREGTGPAITGPRRISADYVGQVWGKKRPFEVTYTSSPQPFSVGISHVIPAWDKALSGLKEGARVLIVAPPSVAYGASAQGPIPANSTLIFVIDVRGVD